MTDVPIEKITMHMDCAVYVDWKDASGYVGISSCYISGRLGTDKAE
jgi:hypothetical protein